MKPKCNNCGKTFSEKRKALGYDNCIDCANKTVVKYIGRRVDGRHDGTTEIFRSSSEIKVAKAFIKRENVIGFGTNVGVSHPSVEQNKEDYLERIEG